MHLDTEILFTSERLEMRKFVINDANFVLNLVNSPGWLEFIGNRGIYTLLDASAYILSGPMRSYMEHGFGGWVILHQATKNPIGLCGLFKRDYLDFPDLGFALLPSFEGKGYATESASATINYVKQYYGLQRLYAVANPMNQRSIHVLEKCGFSDMHTNYPAEMPKDLRLLVL